MASDKLNQAMQLIKAGNKQAALPLLKNIVQSEPNNEMSWLLLYSCVEPFSQKKYCLQKALEINPNNQNARTALKKLTELEQSGNPKESKVTEKRQKTANPTANPAPKQKSKSNNKVFPIGGALLLLFLCIGAVAIGSWGYKNFFTNNNVQNADSPLGLPGPCNNDLLEEFKSKSFAGLSFKITKSEYEDYQKKHVEDMKWIISNKGDGACQIGISSIVNGEKIISPIFYIDLETRIINADDNIARQYIDFMYCSNWPRCKLEDLD